MKSRRLLLVVLPLTAVFAGCAMNEAVLTGHDFIDEAAAALRTGIDEYHADDVQRIATARRHVVAAFVKDIVSAGGDAAGVEAKTQEFLALLGRADQASQAEQERRRRLMAWLEKLEQTNAEMREIAQYRLLWDERMRSYVQRLREKANVTGSRYQLD